MSMNVPGEEDWQSWQDDLDQAAAHRMFAGLAMDQALGQFSKGHIIERVDEIRWMPPVPFQYYVVALGRYLDTGLAFSNGDPASAASGFLNLVSERLNDDPGTVHAISDDLLHALDFVRDHQKEFHAPLGIYGDFEARVAEIKRVMETIQR